MSITPNPPSSREAPAAPAGPQGEPLERPIVFVIDDDDSVRRSLERLLRSVDLDVETFASAQDFLRKPMPDRPACVVLDLRLPGPSGLELQESLIRSGHDVPIVFISGHADVPSSVRAIKAGAVDFLQKPFSDQALLDIIHGALRRDREARRDRAEDRQHPRAVRHVDAPRARRAPARHSGPAQQADRE